MKSFHKDYTKEELKIIIKSWNKHFRIYITGKTKKQLADELDKHLEHDEDDEIGMKTPEGLTTGLTAYHEKKEKQKQTKKQAKEDAKTEKERERLRKIVEERHKKDAEEKEARRKEEESRLQKQKEIKRKEQELRLQKEKEKEKARVDTYSNSKATSQLPYDILEQIFNLLPERLKKEATEGTYQEKRDMETKNVFKFFESKKYGKTKKEGEKFFFDLLDQSEEFQEYERNRAHKITDDLYNEYVDNTKRRLTLDQREELQQTAMDKGYKLAMKYYIEEFIDLKKEGKTNKEIVEYMLDRGFEY